jgi:glycerol-3-phosphate acyltransferase PlsY
MVENLIFGLFTYFFSSIPFGLVIGKIFYNKDIRLEGSKNIGATNVLRLCGKTAGFFTFLLDGLKGAIPVILAKHFLGGQIFYLVGLVAILGHIFPIYLKFKGGKGVATTLLVLFAIDVKFGGLALLIWVLSFVLFGFSSLSSILMSVLLVLFSASYSLNTGDYYLLLFNIIFTLLILFKHKENIKRLITKQEPKVFKKSVF